MRGNNSYATHQVTRFWKDSCRTYGAAIEHLFGYLRGTCDSGLILDMNQAKTFELYADACFCGNWYRTTASDSSSNAKSQSGYELIYTGCLILLDFKLQIVIVLSSTYSEYVSLSKSLIYLIPLMGLIKETKMFGFEVFLEELLVHYRVFEDN